ncbi:26456_t:CDS:2, partial [Racocetra persica]
VKRRKLLINALTVRPEYLKNPASESGLVLDYRDWQLPPKHFQNKLTSKYSDLFAISVEQAFSLVCFHVIPNEKSLETSNELTEK